MALIDTAHIPLFLYPFLNTTSKTRPFEYLRLTSLGVIGALVKVSDPSRSGPFRLAPFADVVVAAKRQFGRDQLPPLHRDHPALSPDHGDRLGTLQDRRDLHRPEDPPRRSGSAVHLPDVRAVLRRRRRTREHGAGASGESGGQAAETRREVLSPHE
jgi:hypothetical protein